MCFDLGACAFLFVVENTWLLPKQDRLRVLAEAVAILTIALINHF